jgi:hypothetical protein
MRRKKGGVNILTFGLFLATTKRGGERLYALPDLRSEKTG